MDTRTTKQCPGCSRWVLELVRVSTPFGDLVRCSDCADRLAAGGEA